MLLAIYTALGAVLWISVTRPLPPSRSTEGNPT